MSAGLKDRKARLVRLKACQERLARESKEQSVKQQEKIDQRAVEEALSGGKKRGGQPLAPDEVVNKEKKANVTDPESRIMKTARGGMKIMLRCERA